MNRYAEEMGLTRTHFENSHGLPHPDHLSTARDLAATAVACSFVLCDTLFISLSRLHLEHCYVLPHAGAPPDPIPAATLTELASLLAD